MSVEEQRLRNLIGIKNKSILNRKNRIEDITLELLKIEYKIMLLDRAIYETDSYSSQLALKEKAQDFYQLQNKMKDKRKKVNKEIAKIKTEVRIIEIKLSKWVKNIEEI